MSPKFFLIIAATLALGSCPPPRGNNNANTSTSPPSGSPISLSQSIPDARVFPPKPAPNKMSPAHRAPSILSCRHCYLRLQASPAHIPWTRWDLLRS